MLFVQIWKIHKNNKINSPKILHSEIITIIFLAYFLPDMFDHTVNIVTTPNILFKMLAGLAPRFLTNEKNKNYIKII